jgi:hypothetical protein
VNIVVLEELKAYIEPLTANEHDALERSLLAEGCRDALVLWGEVLVDGHNRYGICEKHGLPYQTVQNPRFASMEDVHLWMIDQHLGRRSLSDFQRGVLALRKREIVAERRARAKADRSAPDVASTTDSGGDEAAALAAVLQPKPLQSREDIARAARLSATQVGMIEKIQKQAAPEVVAAVRSGDISLNAAAVVATLPADEQRAAALAGKDELKLAAKRVRESRRKTREDDHTETTERSEAAFAPASDEVSSLRQRVALLEAENAVLREQVQMLSAQLV